MIKTISFKNCISKDAVLGTSVEDIREEVSLILENEGFECTLVEFLNEEFETKKRVRHLIVDNDQKSFEISVYEYTLVGCFEIVYGVEVIEL